MQILTLLVLFFLNCAPEKMSQYASFSEYSKPGIGFSYGVQLNPKQLGEQNPPSDLWGPEFDLDSECIFSQSSTYRALDLGPHISLCFPPGSENRELLKSLKLSFQELNPERPDLQISSGTIHIRYLPLSEIIEKIKETSYQFLLLGDNQILSEWEKTNPSPDETTFSFGKNIFSKFSLPYFSLWITESNLSFAFPTSFQGGRKLSNQYLWIYIERSNDYNLNPIQLKHLILERNDQYFSECLKENPEISEVGIQSDSSVGKYLEFTNRSTNPICPDSIQFKINSSNYEFKKENFLILPGGSLLISEKETQLNGNSELSQKITWKEITKGSEIKTPNKESFSLPKIFITASNNEFFSFRSDKKSCSGVYHFLESEGCHDPGISIVKSVEVCDENQFKLNEVSFKGLSINKKNNYYSKFIELVYLGEGPCNVSGLNLVSNSLDLALSATDRIISKGEILLIGDREFFLDPNLIHRSLKSLDETESIFLKSEKGNFEIYKPLPPNETFLLKNNLTSSSLLMNPNPVVHTEYKSKFLNPIYRNENFCSPGEKFESGKEIGKAYLSEVFYASSIDNGKKNSKDRFLELFIEKKGNFELRIYSNNILLSKYFFTTPRDNDYLTISAEDFSCFEERGVHFLEPGFTLPRNEFLIELFSEGHLLDSLSIDPRLNMGIASTDLSVSYSRIPDTHIWKNSSKSTEITKDSCFNATYASPGIKNSFSPYFQTPDTLFFPISSVPFTKNMRFYSPGQGTFNETVNFSFFSPIVLNTQYTNFFVPESLIYSEWEEDNEVQILSPNGLMISGIMPNPENSQDEWILICNRSRDPINTRNYSVRDNSSADYFVPLSERIPNSVGKFGNMFSGDSSEILPEQCGYILDPDFQSPALESIGRTPTLLFTVKSGSTIGNGLGSDEGVNLFKQNGSTEILVHSYGNSLSNYPFKIKADKGEVIFLKENRNGSTARDYRIEKW